MKTIFGNNGVIDVTGITTFGVSAKEEGSIGFFGTGLKYAIAIILRLGGEITINAGTDVFNFSKETRVVRGKTFDIITMNGIPLGFTTELGKTWEPWQAFRELYCNALDEGGKCWSSLVAPEPEEGKTTVIVNCDEITLAYNKREEYVLLSAPMITGLACDIHPGESQYVFYRGIRAHKLGSPSKYTYNLTGLQELTEDRTLKYYWCADDAISASVTQMEDEHFIRDFLTAPDNMHESNISFEHNTQTSQAFLDVVRELRVSNHPQLNRTALTFYTKQQLANMVPEDSVLNDVEKLDLERAIGFATRLGFPVSEFPICVVETLGGDIVGKAEHGKIYLSKRVFMIGAKYIVSTLIEEFIHLKHGYSDCSRSMQNFLFDALVHVGEQALGEKL